MAALQGHMHLTYSSVGESISSATAAVSSSIVTSSVSLSAGASSGITAVPSFISTYCTLGNSSLSSPSWFGSRGAVNDPSAAISHSLPPLFVFGPSASTPVSPSSPIKPFVVGPGYSPIPDKLVMKIRSCQFVDLADLLAENLKAQEAEPQTYLDGKLLVSSTKKRVQEITEIMTWVVAFTVYAWIFCSAFPSRWDDMTQYKLLILKTARQFSGKSWLHYDVAFCKNAAAAGVVDWS